MEKFIIGLAVGMAGGALLVANNCKLRNLVKKNQADIMKKCGFKVTDHQVKFFGLCEECRKEIAN